MNKMQKAGSPLDLFKKNKLFAIVGLIVLLCLLLFVFRGWTRMTVLPGAVEAMYGNSVEKVYKDEMSKLQDPLSLLGYGGGSPTQGCHTVVANGVKTQVDCDYEVKAFQVLVSSPESKKTLQANAEKLQTLLKTNGWQGEYMNEGQPITSLVKLILSLTSDIDYQPDATYQKHVGDVRCYLQNHTAFSHPDPAAIGAHIYCSRTFNVLGQPSWD